MIADTLKPYVWAAGAAGVLAIAVCSGVAGWTAQGWRKDAEIQALKASHAGGVAVDAVAALQQFQQAASTVATAASQAGAENVAAARQFAALAKEFRNAPPLPADCRPDDVRLRNRNAAIETYNAARTGSVPGR